jgi:transposase InsO family protein
MPWKVDAVSELRFALCHAVRSLHRPVAAAAREFGKTAHKWLDVFDAAAAAAAAAAASPGAGALADRPRRPRRSPARTGPEVERLVLDARDRFNWGPRKIHAFLLQQAARDALPTPPLPSVRTLGAILGRNGRVKPPPPADAAAVQRFERERPNQLWQVDHKGPVEVERGLVTPFTVIDDHSRYCLAFRPCHDKTMSTAFDILWELFGDVGLPDAVLSDNAFNAAGVGPGLSWFDARLIRLGIRPLHGRPYHPQTQGKCERFHGSAVREFICFNARRDTLGHFGQDAEHWRGVYNTLRPHEALGDRPPVERWRPADRRRPATLPEPSYQPGLVTRTIDDRGAIHFDGYKILVGRGLAGDRVRVDDAGNELRVFYCDRQVRSLSPAQLVRGRML